MATKDPVHLELATIMDPLAFNPDVVCKNVGQEYDRDERRMTALEHARRVLEAGWTPPSLGV